MANASTPEWAGAVWGWGFVPVWLRPFQGDTKGLSRGLDPVSWSCSKAGPDFLGGFGLGLSGFSGGEDTAKPEMMIKCESWVGVHVA